MSSIDSKTYRNYQVHIRIFAPIKYHSQLLPLPQQPQAPAQARPPSSGTNSINSIMSLRPSFSQHTVNTVSISTPKPHHDTTSPTRDSVCVLPTVISLVGSQTSLPPLPSTLINQSSEPACLLVPQTVNISLPAYLPLQRPRHQPTNHRTAPCDTKKLVLQATALLVVAGRLASERAARSG